MQSSLEILHTSYLREKKYIDNVSPKTVRFLTQSFNAFTRVVPEVSEVESLPGSLNEFVIRLRESGRVKPVTVNTYIRGVNCFLSWLSARGSLPSGTKIGKLRVDATIPRVVDVGSLRKLVEYRGSSHSLRRVHAIVMTIMDTGLRITEVITLERDGGVDMENLILRVMGKGRRERLVPMSVGLRRILTVYSTRDPEAHPGHAEYFFCSKDGGILGYRNLLRDYQLMCGEIGIDRPGGFHRLRHTFASAFMAEGGNQFHLKQILGHTTLKTTDIYVHSDVDGLRRGHNRASVLGRYARGGK
jgi:integrase/recombinase XerC